MKMKCLRPLIISAFLLAPLTCALTPSWGDDLEDDISKYTDESISSEEELGKSDTNVNFVVQEALAKSKKRNKDKDSKDPKAKDSKGSKSGGNSQGGDKNDNSIVFGAGSQVRGPVYNVHIGK